MEKSQIIAAGSTIAMDIENDVRFALENQRDY